jgi:hypothetical protein
MKNNDFFSRFLGINWENKLGENLKELIRRKSGRKN